MAANSDLNMRFFGSPEDAERALVQLEQKYERLENQIKQTGRASRRSSDGSVAGMFMQVQAIQAVGGELVNMTHRIEEAMRAEVAFRQEAERAGAALDETVRKFQIQQGLGGLSGADAELRATEIAMDAGVSQQSVLRIGKQLASTGFRDPLQGGSAEAVIAFLQSTAQDVDSADLEGVVSAFAQQLAASNQELTGTNLLNIAKQTRGLFGETPLEAPDLIAFAQARGLAENLGVSQEDFLSSAALIKHRQSAEQGATGLGNFFSKLSGPKRFQMQALEELGLETTDVDFVGEELPEVAGRIARAVDALPEERRTPVLTRLFGAEKSQITAALTLLDAAREGGFDRMAGLQDDDDNFDFGVNQARTSQAATLRRLEAREQFEQLQFSKSGGILETEAEAANRIESLVIRRRLRGQHNLTLGAGRAIGMDDAALYAFWEQLYQREGTGGLSQAGRDLIEQERNPDQFSVEELNASLQENAAAQREANNNAGRIDRNAQVEGVE